MAGPGDIVYIHSYVDANGDEVSAHPFIVLAEEYGTVDGKRYNLIGVAISSYKNSFDKTWKSINDKTIVNVYVKDGVVKDSFVKCGCLVYFNLEYYQKIGTISDEAWNNIVMRVEELDEIGLLEENTRNL